jgi:energy-coupling factor transporter transmembrane protein EcfT
MPVSSPIENSYEGAPAKLLFCASGSLLALWLNQGPPLVFLALATTARAMARIDLKLLLKLYLFLAVILVICLLGAAWLPKIGPASLPVGGLSAITLKMSLQPVLRMLISANLTLGLVLTTSSGALARFIASLPLPNCLFIPVSVAFRFVPTFLNELTAVREALLVRTRRTLLKTALLSPWLLWRGFMGPLIFRALSSADDLAVAVEMKNLSRANLHWAKPPVLDGRDGPALSLAAAVAAAAIWLQYNPEFWVTR